MFKKILFGGAATAVALGGVALGASAASAAPVPSAHATTHVLNRPDGGNGGTWAFDTFNRSMTVTVANSQAGTGGGNTRYRVDITDKGGFTTVLGAGTPNQFIPGTHVLHKVSGSMAGGITYTVVAPTTDALTGVVPSTENDAFGPAHVTTGNWAKQAFSNPALVTTESAGTVYGWKYSTGCENWADTSANGDGNTANDGNITGSLCTHSAPPVSARPYVYAGHDVLVGTTRATVGWSESAANSPWLENLNPPLGGKCEEVREWGFGFSAADGSPHVGFTCSHNGSNTNEGFLTGLTPGHTYALEVTPAVGTYMSHHPIPGAHSGFINVVTATS